MHYREVCDIHCIVSNIYCKKNEIEGIILLLGVKTDDAVLPGEWYRWTEHLVRIECIAVVFA